jgi:UMF1 family MFS transporter
MMVPETRATEFFGFFGFIGKAASVIGPWVYFLVSTTMDDRVAVFSILLLILIGTAMMYWVDVEEGTRVAKQEDAIKRGGAEEA